MSGWVYILQCSDNSFYTGSTNNLEMRLAQHQHGEGANYTKKRLPVKLVFSQEYERVDAAFYVEKQVQGWSRKKKQALINGDFEKLPELAECQNDSHFGNQSTLPFDSAQGPVTSVPISNRGDAAKIEIDQFLQDKYRNNSPNEARRSFQNEFRSSSLSGVEGYGELESELSHKGKS